MLHELAQRIGHQVRQFHAQRVLIDQRRVAQPIVDAVFSDVRNDHECIVFIEIQALYARQFGVTIAEFHSEMIGFIAGDALQIAVSERLGKGTKRHVIGQEMLVTHALDVGNM